MLAELQQDVGLVTHKDKQKANEKPTGGGETDTHQAGLVLKRKIY